MINVYGLIFMRFGNDGLGIHDGRRFHFGSPINLLMVLLSYRSSSFVLLFLFYVEFELVENIMDVSLLLNLVGFFGFQVLVKPIESMIGYEIWK